MGDDLYRRPVRGYALNIRGNLHGHLLVRNAGGDYDYHILVAIAWPYDETVIFIARQLKHGIVFNVRRIGDSGDLPLHIIQPYAIQAIGIADILYISPS